MLGEAEIGDFRGDIFQIGECLAEFPDREHRLVSFASPLNPSGRGALLSLRVNMGSTVISDTGFSLRLARQHELGELVRIDEAAGTLFAQVGIIFGFGWDHPFAQAELARWNRAIELGLAHVAVDSDDRPLGFVTLETIDGAPYMNQLSVHPTAMRRGIGRALVRRAIKWSDGRPLWLTTYSHVPWNAPYYRRLFNFEIVPELECGAELRGILESERAILPDPECRVAMVLRAE